MAAGTLVPVTTTPRILPKKEVREGPHGADEGQKFDRNLHHDSAPMRRVAFAFVEALSQSAKATMAAT